MKDHPSAEELALLAEGQIPSSAPGDLELHLGLCRHCLRSYEEAVRARAAWLGPELPSLSPEETRLAYALGPGRPTSYKPVRGVKRFWEGLRPVPVAATLAVLAGIVLIKSWSISPWQTESGPPPIPEVVAQLVEGASGTGLVLPGGEAGADRASAVYRDGGGPVPLTVQSALSEMASDYLQDPSAGLGIWMVAGYIAAGQLHNARTFTELSSERLAEDPRILILRAVLAYRDSRLLESESLLLEALAAEPENETARLNLGIVLREQGRVDRARPHLEEVARSAPDSPLAARARTVLETLSSER